MTTKKNLSADVFANFAAKREAEQKEIEKVGVFGEHTSVTEEDIPIAEEVVIEETDPVEIAAEAGVMEDVTEDLSDIVFEELESETNKKSVGRPRGRKAKKEPVIDWGIKHGCYAYEAKDAYGYARKLKLYDIEPIADQITQDIYCRCL